MVLNPSESQIATDDTNFADCLNQNVRPMTTVSTLPRLAEQRTLLHHVSWQLFENLLTELGDNRACRLTYDQGDLEIMAPSSTHEHANRVIERLIIVMVEELGLEVKSVGSLTCKREELKRGAEPDSCYYIQHEAFARNKDSVDLNKDPPPDLVVEIEYTSSALPKLPLYASLRVPELWRYDGHHLLIYQLVAGQYVPCPISPTFAPIKVTDIPRFLRKSQQVGEIKMTRAFRGWVRKQLKGR
jgi:Uma2 family endonuclease